MTRTLATGQTRRGLLKGLTGTAIGGMLAAAGLRGTALAAPAAKTTICHWDATRATYQQLSVPAKDLKGHARHTQDILAPDFTSPQTCGSCTNACGTGDTCLNGNCVEQEAQFTGRRVKIVCQNDATSEEFCLDLGHPICNYCYQFCLANSDSPDGRELILIDGSEPNCNP